MHYVKSVLYSELFRSAFSRIRAEYGEIRSISPYSDRMRENVDQNNPNTDTFHAVMSLMNPPTNEYSNNNNN